MRRPKASGYRMSAAVRREMFAVRDAAIRFLTTAGSLDRGRRARLVALVLELNAELVDAVRRDGAGK